MSKSFSADPPRGFYGRRSGRGLRGQQADLMADYHDHPLSLTLTRPCPRNVTTLFPTPVETVWLESGFGAGEHLVFRARENPTTGFIGIEPFKNGMARALQLIEESGVQNIRLYYAEGGFFLDWLNANCLKGIYLLYPDPWPKRRHFKRRFVNHQNVLRIQRVLMKSAQFRFASDDAAYVHWTLAHCQRNPAFHWLNGSLDNTATPWDNWPGTRYEKKAIKAGRRAYYLTFEVNNDRDQ